MAVVYPRAFDASPAAGFDGKFDWDFLKPAFAPTTIEPMDFDGVVERRGKFLVFETKTGNKPIPQGQVIALESAVRTGVVTVIILRAKHPRDIDRWDEWHLGLRSRRIEMRHIEGDADALVARARKWFLWASEKAA